MLSISCFYFINNLLDMVGPCKPAVETYPKVLRGWGPWEGGVVDEDLGVWDGGGFFSTKMYCLAFIRVDFDFPFIGPVDEGMDCGL